MKRADIVVGEIYAYAQQREWEPSRYDRQRGQIAMKVEVLEVGIERKTNSYGANPKDGVRVRLLAEHHQMGMRQHAVGESFIGTTRNVRELWSTFEPRRAAYTEAQRVRADDRNARGRASTERLRALMPSAYEWPEGTLPQQTRDGRYTTRTTITYEVLADMLEIAAIEAVEQVHRGKA